uniref:Uncharacterized protein n=1 Tax=Capra hircus TaxID=9925 RepID=A0A8C2RVX7_CAPHI
MLILAGKLKRDDGLKESQASATASDCTRQVSVRDRLLVKEAAELEANLPCMYKLTVTPEKGYCQGGKFQLETEVPNAYNMVTLNHVVWGLNSLFIDLLNFDDPLNIEVVEHHLWDKEDFWNKAEDYMKCHARW